MRHFLHILVHFIRTVWVASVIVCGRVCQSDKVDLVVSIKPPLELP